MNIELEPTNENIIETIKMDILGRNTILKRFVKSLYLMKESNIISLNGEWGEGKTFFVKQSIELIKSLSMIDYKVSPEIKEFINKFKVDEMKEIQTEGEFFPIYFNAWEYDSNEDPLLTLIYSIIDQNPNSSEVEKKSESIKEKILRIISSFKIGFSYQDSISGSIGIELQYNGKKEERLTKDIYSVEKVKQTFNELLEEIMIEKTNKLVIFVDELDRCNPTFAVKLLERVKHFCVDDRFIFVFSTNLRELQYTIKKFYGEGMDGYSYLEKFFDLQFSLRRANIENYINSKNVVNVNSGYFLDTCVKEMCLISDFSLRKCNRYIKLMSLVYENIWEGKRRPLASCILFPILLAIKIDDINMYEQIIKGVGEKELKERILKSKEIIGIMNYLFRVAGKDNEFSFNFSELYRAIFINKKEIGYSEVKIGNLNIEHTKERKALMDLLTFLSDYNVS